jgi:hypothetical protein
MSQSEDDWSLNQEINPSTSYHSAFKRDCSKCVTSVLIHQVPLPWEFVVHLIEPLISHVAVWQQLHLNQYFAKICHKCLWKKNLTNNQMIFLRQKLNTWEHRGQNTIFQASINKHEQESYTQQNSYKACDLWYHIHFNSHWKWKIFRDLQCGILVCDMGYYRMWLPKFQRNTVFQTSWQKGEGNMFLWNAGNLLSDYMTARPRSQKS